MSKYQPLGNYLRTLDIDSISLSFQRIKEILGDSLPPIAYRSSRQGWWCNNDTGHPQARAWLSSGWKVDDLNLSEETVTFPRQGHTIL